MNKEELLYERENAKRLYRVIMDGNFEDFYELDHALEYIREKFTIDTYDVALKRMAEITKGAYKGK